MEISLVRKRVVETIESAQLSAAARRLRAEEAGRDYAQFLERMGTPLLRQVANALRAEGYAFTVFTPTGGVRMSSDRTAEDYIEFALDTTGDQPRVLGRVSRSRGRNVVETERPIADRTPAQLTEEDVLGFVLKEIEPFVER
jgi:hypothetical protein